MRLRRLLIALLSFMAITIASAQNPTSPSHSLQIHHMDIGQGDSAVLLSPAGQVVLFDAGKDMANRKNCSSEIDFLDQLGVKNIDYIIVSHYHSDHIGCVPEVLGRFPLKIAAIDRGSSYAGTTYAAYVHATEGKRQTANLGQLITLDAESSFPVTLKVVALNGQFAGGSVTTTNENDLSVSVLVSFGGFREEIGGDLSGENTGDYQDIETGVAPSVGEIDVYKVHHHCSSHSSNSAWLNDTRPTIAVISDGNGNRYGHPASDCLQRLHEAEISKVYWTEQGAVTEIDPQRDVVGGDISIDVPAGAATFTVSYNNGGGTDTYRVKGAQANTLGTGHTPSGTDGIAVPRFAWSAKGRLYYGINCPAVQRIAKANLRTGVDPPADKQPSSCLK
jgi:beta-lactamase superfamily II metal-dependent hydrolase